MRKRWLNVILFLLFLIEGTVFPYFSSIPPRFVLAVIILISIYRDKRYSLFLGLLFGILYDLVFGKVIGIYMIGMAGVGYFTGWLVQFVHPVFLMYSIIQMMSILAFELFVFGMLRLFNIIDDPFSWSFIHIIVPTVLLNLLFALIIYIPGQKLLEKKSR